MFLLKLLTLENNAHLWGGKNLNWEKAHSNCEQIVVYSWGIKRNNGLAFLSNIGKGQFVWSCMTTFSFLTMATTTS